MHVNVYGGCLNGSSMVRPSHCFSIIRFGTPQLRQKIADYYRSVYNCHIDIDTEITVTLGATEGVSVVLRSVAGPGNGR